MNRTSHFLCSMILGLLSVSACSAQGDRFLYDDGPTDSPAGEPGQVSGPPYQPAQLSSWITYPKSKDCCGGCTAGPIETEFYLRVGPSIPIGGMLLNDRLQVGWAIQGGGRSLFFNPETTDAWVVDVGVTNINNNVVFNPTPITLLNITTVDQNGNSQVQPTFNVTMDSINRTFATLAVGREHYLWGTARTTCPGGRSYWRWGYDLGGRYGNMKASFNELQHDTDVIGGFFFSVHTDLEYPCGACIFQVGFRVEYGYTWSDILQRQNNGDTQDINLLFTGGFRF